MKFFCEETYLLSLTITSVLANKIKKKLKKHLIILLIITMLFIMQFRKTSSIRTSYIAVTLCHLLLRVEWRCTELCQTVGWDCIFISKIVLQCYNAICCSGSFVVWLTCCHLYFTCYGLWLQINSLKPKLLIIIKIGIIYFVIIMTIATIWDFL